MYYANTAGQRWGFVSPYHDLSVGESIVYTTVDGAEKKVRLEAVDDRSATVQVNESRAKIPLGFADTTIALPPGELLDVVEMEGLRIGADATKAFMIGTRYSLSLLNLHKDARLYVGEVGQPLSPVGTHIFPLPNYNEWDLGGTWLKKVIYGWHLGVDLRADLGYPIVSVTDGVVVAVRHYDPERDEEDYWGNNLGVLGDDGILYCYMHWDRLAEGIAEGGRVRAGDFIGPLGRTGFETKPFPSHLHFEMMILRHPEKFYFAYGPEPEVLTTPNRFLQPEVDGHVINPYPFLVEWYLGHL
jgi:murein DD-endopeptidase MepM/ murein hydrolase activator NlpD